MARSITQHTTERARKGKKADAAGRCKPKTCPRCGGQECIERPRFFCGQLLTDKDLDAAQRYVIEKNRLHNRYLVGKGVVCGLVVRCEPCDSGSVVVEPGYAIDCCGNDVVVCDPEPFDVAKYIEECFGPQKPDCDPPIRTRRPRCDEGPKEYCLVLSYAEELSQKATALVRDKGCQESRCEFSRVRETFRLDLVERSSLPQNGQPNLWTRIADCLPDTSRKMGLAAAEYYALDFQGPQGRASAERELVRRVRSSVVDLYRNGPDIRCNIEDLLCRDEPVCPTVTVQCPASVPLSTVTNITYTAVITGADQSVTPTYNWTVSAGTIVSGQGTAQIIVNANTAGPPQQITATVSVGGYPPECQLTASCTTTVTPPTTAPCPNVSVNCPQLYRPNTPPTFTAVVTGGDPAVTPTFNWSVSAGTITSGQGTASINVSPGPVLVAITATVNVGGYAQNCPTTASCTSVPDPGVIFIAGPGAGNARAQAATAASSLATGTRDDTAVLGEILTPYFQYMIDCFCDALLVPCTPCAEPEGVVLACITVEDGKVVKICNVARTQLITGPALRYWLGPLFTGTHKLIEFLCCRLELRRMRRWSPLLYRGMNRVTESGKSVLASFKPGGAFASYSPVSALSRGGKILSSTARMAANVARAKLGDLRSKGGGTAVTPETMLGAEFFRLDADEARAKLEQMNVSVVEERVAATPEEAATVANLKSMVGVISPRATVEIVKDAQNRVVAVRARPASAAAEEGASKDEQ